MIHLVKPIVALVFATILALPSGLIQAASAQGPEGVWKKVPPSPTGGLIGTAAVWTGEGMIVWSGLTSGMDPGTRRGVRFNLASAAWTETAIAGAPEGRAFHTAVWTGREMIVWGGATTGLPDLVKRDGGRYDADTDVWRSVATEGAPAGRSYHTAVWTGQEMIVWGGKGAGGQPLGDGARYNPATDSWSPLAAAGAPSPRSGHTALWTGQEMIVWGGEGAGGQPLGDGARYNPATDSWSPLAAAGAPSPRTDHTVVWTGEEMVVWGGRCASFPCALGDGARYRPASDSWAPVSVQNAPPARFDHTAVWTGEEMIVWGGTQEFVGRSDGGRYNPRTDAWVYIPTQWVPSFGSPQTGNTDALLAKGHVGFWTGQAMLVWGGDTGVSPSTPPVATGSLYYPPSAVVPHDERYFPQTGFRVDDNTIWDYFVHRGGVDTFGYPISRKFLFQGFQTQFFQRRVVQLDEQGRARLLNILDPGLLPYTRFNGATVPAHDEALVATAPHPTDSRAVLAWVEENAPQTFDGKPVGFYRTFLDTVSLDVAGPDPSFLPGFALEMWGAPTSRPMLDPNNHEFVYLRFQRGIMMYDGATGLTQGVLLGDMLKAVITGEHLPPDLEEQARSSPLYRQYSPGGSLWLRDSGALPHTDLTGAFERQ